MVASILVAAILAPLGLTHAQLPSTAVGVAVGFGVDTVAVPNHEIFALWRGYLIARPVCGGPNALWSRLEQQEWPAVDLLCPYVYQGFTKFTVVHLAPAIGLDSTYVMRVQRVR